MRGTDPIFRQLVESYGQPNTLTIPRALVTLVQDLKAALLLSQIIFWSSKKQETGGWFYKTMREWKEEITLSKHEVSCASDYLEKRMKLISTDTRQVNGAPTKHYRFCEEVYVDLISEKGKSISDLGKSISEKGNSDFPKGENLPYYAEEYSEENIHTSDEKDYPPSTEQNNLDLEDPVEVFLKNAYSRLRRPRFKLKKSDGNLAERLGEAEIKWGMVDLRRAVLAFLSDEGDWLRNAGWPIRVFMSNPDRWMEKSHTTPQKTKIPSPPPLATPPAPTNGSLAPPPLPDLVGKWDSLVLSCPVSMWDDSVDKIPSRFYADKEFLGNFDAICVKAEKIHQNKPEAKWLNFRWLFKMKDGSYNWRKVARGDYDFLAAAPDKTNKPKSRADQGSAAIDQLLAERKAKREAGTKATDTPAD